MADGPEFALVCSGEVIGFITIDSGDNFTLLGAFRPTPAFNELKPIYDNILAADRRMQEIVEAGGNDRSYEAASDDWHAALDRANELALT